ncbi:hypothetical protein ACFWPA_01440 [Rhodococcus sp. NPDC058505]|uniref:hypothetical protein n=1 Tax=unclassified Rhodococcus (in: high G+C Gram-positive bacteria) TaxID=192944 RepID=UPI0036497ADA
MVTHTARALAATALLAPTVFLVGAGPAQASSHLTTTVTAGPTRVLVATERSTPGGTSTCNAHLESGPVQHYQVTLDAPGSTLFTNVTPGPHTVTFNCGGGMGRSPVTVEVAAADPFGDAINGFLKQIGLTMFITDPTCC